MSNKKQSIVTTEVFIENGFSNTERAHILEHVHFLEERTSELEAKVKILGRIFTDLLALDEDEDDEEDYEDEYEDDEEDEDEDEDELANFFSKHCVCSWEDDEDDEEND
jgi:hypothetical protein